MISCIRRLLLKLPFILLAPLFTCTPVLAEDGGYPFASYHGPGTNAANSTWTDADGNPISPYGYYFRNCTDFVAWKLQSLGIKDTATRGLGNAASWGERARSKNLQVDSTPAVGAAAVAFVGNYGHVGFVDAMQANGTITIAEYNYHLDGSFSSRSGTPQRLGFTTFVHFEKLLPPPLLEPTPPRVPWHFETMDGDQSSLGKVSHVTGETPQAITFNGQAQLFYYDVDQHALRHAWTDEKGWHFEYLDGIGGMNGRVSCDVGRTPTSVVFNGTLQVFYYDASHGSLRHAWADIAGWHFETLDGDAASFSHLNANVGTEASALQYGGSLQVFYYDLTHHTLRHAWAGELSWQFETLEGDAGSISHYTADVGQTSSASIFAGGLHLFTYDKSGGHLRHAWTDGIAGWRFENLDGDQGAIGHQMGPVGGTSTAVNYGATMQVFYFDQSRGALRHAWISSSEGWQFETLEGGGAIKVGAMPSVAVSDDSIHLFYYDITFGNLRHAWSTPQQGWQRENLDGAGGDNPGRLKANVGYDPVAVNLNGKPHVFYFDQTNGNLRHSWPY